MDTTLQPLAVRWLQAITFSWKSRHMSLPGSCSKLYTRCSHIEKMAGFSILLSMCLFRFADAVFKQAGAFRACERGQGIFQESSIVLQTFLIRFR